MKREKRLQLQAAQAKFVRDVLNRCQCGASIPPLDGETTCLQCDPGGVAENIRKRCIDCEQRPGIEEIQVGDLTYYRCAECVTRCERERPASSSDRDGANDCVPNEEK